MPLVCSKAGSEEGVKYKKVNLLSPTLNVVGFFLRETECSLLDTRKMVKGYQGNRQSVDQDTGKSGL